MRDKRSRGFTLVEMMVVIVIIGILATVVITQISGKADQAKVTATKALITQISGAVDLFKMYHNRYPEQLEDLVRMPSYVDPTKWPQGGYLKKTPLDGWERPFKFRYPGTGGQPYDIISWGEDGVEGGDGYAADLWNHESYRR